MPYTINWEHHGVVIHLFDKITKYEPLSIIGNLIGNSKFDLCEYQLLDMSKVTEVIYQEEDIKILAALTKQADEWNNHSLVIFVTCDKQVTEHIISYTDQMKNLGIIIEHVHSLDEAKKRIDIHLSQNLLNKSQITYK